ncbi:MAG TPA: amidohydrolase family protein [Terriglobales bacterium]|jgi:imidazolonepropionase-like amidohydrolase|nr:amidohydrolase family protein [Terriglobales bacterium]
MRRLSVLVPLFCWAAAAQTISPEVKKFVKVDAQEIVLEHVRVIDGTGGPAREDQTLILSHGKVESIGNSRSADTAPGNRAQGVYTLDLHGRTVIPGLVGMHDHMFYPMGNAVFGEMAYSFPRLYLAGGVTTVRTTGSLEPYTDLELKKAIDAGAMPGPKMHVTGPYLEGQGTFALQLHQLSGADDAIKTANYWMEEGVDNFKAYMFITPEELSAAIAVAHKRGIKVTGHLCSIGFREAARLGIDDLEHGLLVDTEFFPEKKPGECPDVPDDMVRYGKLKVQSGPVHDMILDLIKHQVALTSTLPVFEVEVPGRPAVQARTLEALSAEARSQFLANKVQVSDTARLERVYKTSVSPMIAAFQKEMEFEHEFAKEGGLLLAGLDPTGIGGVVAGYGDQREVELLVEAGFTPVEAIHIATYNGAKYLGELDRIGTIEPGKQADLVVIRGDLAADITAIENVEIVFKDGIGYDSAKLIDSVRGMVGSR